MLFLKKHGWWVLSIVICMCISAGILMYRNKDEVEVEIHGTESSETADSSNRSLGGSSMPTKQPPLGETHDMGYWEGDTWHQRTPNEAAESSLWDELWLPKKWGADKYYEMLRLDQVPDEFKGPDGKDYAGWYRSIIAEYPNSKAALVARYKLVAKGSFSARADNLKELLKYYPESRLINAEIAWLNASLYPEEAIAFAKKALRLPPYGWDTEIGELDLLGSFTMHSHKALSRAYQRLGDYKTAMVHLKKVRSLLLPEIGDMWVSSAYETYGEEIEAIKAGKPLIGPDPVDVQVVDSEDVFGMDDISVSTEPPASVDDAFDFSPDADDDVFLELDRPDRSETSAYRERMREAAEAARAAFVSRQEQKQREFESFLRWMEAIERAESPADLEDFLMREMARTLQGEGGQFAPDRLIRAYETMERYGKTEGLTKLSTLDREVAEAMLQARPSHRKPPQRNNSQRSH